MSVALFTTYSAGNAELAALTHPNHEAYATAHGYVRIAEEIPYAAAHLANLQRIRDLLDRHDYVLSHGSDVLFMNTRWKVTDLDQGEDVTVAREAIGWWPINNDVMLWKNSAGARWMLHRLITAEPEWRDYAWKWQTHLWNVLQSVEFARTITRLAAPREMNATPHAGASQWQLGDPVLHFVGLPMARRIAMAKEFLRYAGDGTWKQ